MSTNTLFTIDDNLKTEYVDLLTKLMQHVESLQNNPSENLQPKEDLVADEVVAFLDDVKDVLDIQKHAYVEGRSNLIVKYVPDGVKDDQVVSFVGMHMDVVPANKDTWEFDPFSLTVDPENSDKLRGRGVTDCLGHVALMAVVMKNLGQTKPQLTRSVWSVFIANEECSEIEGVGVDMLQKDGKLDGLKNGPLFWMDSAESQPTIGTGGTNVWELTATGKLFHSGLPQKAVNAIELVTAGTQALQTFFYENFPRVPMEETYGFAVPSSMKPTQFRMPAGSSNQIPGSATMSGDIRMTPFYDINEVMTKCDEFVANLDVTTLTTYGPSKFEITDEELTGKLELTWKGDPYKGVACDIESDGFKALSAAIEQVKGESKPYSVTGSLPLIADLKDGGFDVQCIGFGEMSAYHAQNEYGFLSNFMDGIDVVERVIRNLGQ